MNKDKVLGFSIGMIIVVFFLAAFLVTTGCNRDAEVTEDNLPPNVPTQKEADKKPSDYGKLVMDFPPEAEPDMTVAEAPDMAEPESTPDMTETPSDDMTKPGVGHNCHTDDGRHDLGDREVPTCEDPR